jgi:hypothetical protein
VVEAWVNSSGEPIWFLVYGVNWLWAKARMERCGRIGQREQKVQGELLMHESNGQCAKGGLGQQRMHLRMLDVGERSFQYDSRSPSQSVFCLCYLRK